MCVSGRVFCFRRLKRRGKCGGHLKKVSYSSPEDCCQGRGVGFATRKVRSSCHQKYVLYATEMVRSSGYPKGTFFMPPERYVLQATKTARFSCHKKDTFFMAPKRDVLRATKKVRSLCLRKCTYVLHASKKILSSYWKSNFFMPTKVPSHVARKVRSSCR